MTAKTQPRCTFLGINGDAEPCNRAMLGNGIAAFCPVHDRIKCTAPVDGPRQCGHRLLGGSEQTCPQCGASVRLQDVLKRGGA